MSFLRCLEKIFLMKLRMRKKRKANKNYKKIIDYKNDLKIKFIKIKIIKIIKL